jgi:hypothetical protein
MWYATLHKIRQPNTLTAVAGLGLCLALLYAVAALSVQRPPPVRQQRPSSFFSYEGGTRAIYLVLQRLLPAVAQWRKPLTTLAPPGSAEAPTTLLVFGPSQALSLAQAQALDAWIAQGGQAIFALDKDWSIKHAVQDRAQDTSDQSTEPGAETAADMTYLQRHGVRIIIPDEPAAPAGGTPPLTLEQRALAWDDAAGGPHEALVMQGQSIVASSTRLGRGRLIVIPDAAAFSNHRLRTTENAVWLVTVCAAWGNGKVMINEFHHGFGAKRGPVSLLAQFLRTPWGWVGLQVSLAGILYVYGHMRRFGRIEDSPSPSRVRVAELIAARSGLFAAAHARRLAVELLHQHLNYALSQRIGYAVTLDDAATRTRLSAHSTALAASLERYMALATPALHGMPISDQTLVQIGQYATHIRHTFRSP